MTAWCCCFGYWLTVIVLSDVYHSLVKGAPLKNDTIPAAHRLLDDLFLYYRKEILPVANISLPVDVHVHLWFKQVLKVDEIDQVLTIYLWIEEYWKDDFLTWDPKDYGGVDVLHVPAERVWRPDLLFYNNADMNVKENELTTNAVLNYTGDVMCFRAIITKITCNLDMTYFPFDQQNCSMMLASWSADGSKLDVIPKEATNNLVYYIENTEWKLLNFSVKQHKKYYDCCPEPYPDITYYFMLERNPSYYVLNLIIPSVFITIVTMVGFFTPYSSAGENTEKVSLGVTALLSLAIILLMVADKMPATSKVVPLIGKYYIGLIWLIFAATIITTVTLRLQSKGNAGKPLSPGARKLFFGYIASVLCMKLDFPPKPRNLRRHDLDRRAEYGKGVREPLIQVVNGGVGTGNANGNQCKKPPGHAVAESPLSSLMLSNRTISETLLSTTAELEGRRALVWTRHCGAASCNEHNAVYGAMTDTLSAMTEIVTRIDDRLEWQMNYETIQHEWGQLARVVERLLMIVFIIGTILFAALITVLAVPIPMVSFWG